MARLNDVVDCFLYLDFSNDGDGIPNLKLQKLVYYAQGFYSAIFDEKLFKNDISAWALGPVVESLYHTYKRYGRNIIPPVKSFDRTLLTDNEYELIEEVYSEFGRYSAWCLRDMTHEEKPWLDHCDVAGFIPADEIKAYFKTRI